MDIYRTIPIMIGTFLVLVSSGCSYENNSTENNCSIISSDDSSKNTASGSTDDLDVSPSYTVENSNIISDSSRCIAAERAARIVASINRKDIGALVNVYLIDFTLDGFPELVISYDTASGHSFVENEVYDLRSENPESIFSFRSSGISRGYEDSIFLYTNPENETFYTFIYGINSGNNLKLDYVDRLFCQNGDYQVKNVFSSTVSSDATLYSSEFLHNGNAIDEISFEQEKNEWFSCLEQHTVNTFQVPIEADEWDNVDVLEAIFAETLYNERICGS